MYYTYYTLDTLNTLYTYDTYQEYNTLKACITYYMYHTYYTPYTPNTLKVCITLKSFLFEFRAVFLFSGLIGLSDREKCGNGQKKRLKLAFFKKKEKNRLFNPFF